MIFFASEIHNVGNDMEFQYRYQSYNMGLHINQYLSRFHTANATNTSVTDNNVLIWKILKNRPRPAAYWQPACCCVFPFLAKIRKFKMAAIFGEGKIF